MSKLYTNKNILLNLHKKKSTKSEIISQIVFGESFKIIKKEKDWLKIKIMEDKYIGFINKKKIDKFIQPTHKISSLYANVYKSYNFKKKIGKLFFGSKIKLTEKKNNFIKFENKWIEQKNVKSINYLNKSIFSNIKIFKNTRYKWGGKTCLGIDCSALVQIFFNFNNNFCPRDAKDQVKFFKKNVQLKYIKKNDIIYWKGHVAIALSKTKLIHAYGPFKKTVVMNINKTIQLIKKTANLKVIAIKRL